MWKGKGFGPGEGGTYFLYFSEELAFLQELVHLRSVHPSLKHINNL